MGFEENNPLPFSLTELDRKILSMTDDEYVPHDWESVKDIIKANRLADFCRSPSQLKLYMQWTVAMKKKYGNITNYLCKTRLHWTPRSPGELGSTFAFKNALPFADPDDYKILLNDWPYGLSPDLVHLVVWSKTTVPTDPETGDVTSESRARIEDFVQKTFIQPLRERGKGDDSVLWFKNWTKLQSVRAVEHFHVIVKDADEDLIRKWTGWEVMNPFAG